MSAVIVVAATAFFFLWHRSTVNAVLGFALLITAMLMVERMIHTVYALTSDGLLSIERGRFAHSLTIPLNEIITIKAVRLKPFMVKVVVLEYGTGRVTSVQPQDCDAFINELKNRQKTLTESILTQL